mgnify:CR=1 FL=1
MNPKNKKQVTNRTTSVSERGTQHRSMLQTETTQLTWEEFFSPLSAAASENRKAHSLKWNVEPLVQKIKDIVFAFLESRDVPYNNLPRIEGHSEGNGIIGQITSKQLAPYDHIPGVKSAFEILFSLHCFDLDREKHPEKAYVHLLRAALNMQAIVAAKMEAQFFAGKGTQYGGKKASSKRAKRDTKQLILDEFRKYRDEGKTPADARRLAKNRVKVSQSWLDQLWRAAAIEEEYQRLKKL